jgi:hypothetical protein
MRGATAVASAPDPYIIEQFSTVEAREVYRALAGKVISDPRLNAGERTGVFIVAGQSNAANTGDTRFTPNRATKVDQINIFDGGTYRAVDPLLGCATSGAGGNMFSRVADKLVAASTYDRVILIPIAVGSTSVNDWTANPSLNQRLIVAAKRAAAVGLPITAYLWMQGEKDKFLGTSQAAYQAALQRLIAIPRAAGFNAPWLIGQCSYDGGSTSSAVRAAQAAVVNGIDIFAGADTDGLTGTGYRAADDVHMKAAGQDAAADLWTAAIAAMGLAYQATRRQ